jgi:hypothetical protein
MVKLSGHAFERWKMRVSSQAKRKEVVLKIRRRIATELKNGAEVNRHGALEIEIRPKIWAICFPSLLGGWEVATIIREGWNGDMEERAMYGEEDRLSKEDYEITQNLLLNQASLVAMLPLEKFIRSINYADAAGPIFDPTLYQKVLYGRGADNWETIKDIAAAALELKKAVKRAEGRYKGVEA